MPRLPKGSGEGGVKDAKAGPPIHKHVHPGAKEDAQEVGGTGAPTGNEDGAGREQADAVPRRPCKAEFAFNLTA